MAIRILLIDDHHMVREALISAINHEADLCVVGEANDGRSGLTVLRESAPDVVVLDIALPDVNGIELVQHILRLNNRIRIVALSGYQDRIFVEEMFKAGAHAYVTKLSRTEELFRAVRAVHSGNRFVSPEIAFHLVSAIDGITTATTPPSTILSPREREVLCLLAEGKRAHDIASSLGITPGTVEVHRRNIKDKVGVRTTAELTRYAIREGLAAR